MRAGICLGSIMIGENHLGDRNNHNETRFGGFLLPGVYMLTKSLLLTDQWDITLDDTGSMAITANPYAVAQDVACACSTFLGEAWYDTTLGIPYYERILGHWPGTQLINTKMTTEAKKLPYVQAAFCTTTVGKADRLASGVMTITDTNNVQTTIQF